MKYNSKKHCFSFTIKSITKKGVVAKPVCRKRILMCFLYGVNGGYRDYGRGFVFKNNRCPREFFLFLLRNHPVITKNASVHSVNSVHSVRKCSFKISRFCNSSFFRQRAYIFPGYSCPEQCTRLSNLHWKIDIMQPPEYSRTSHPDGTDKHSAEEEARQ